MHGATSWYAAAKTSNEATIPIIAAEFAKNYHTENMCMALWETTQP